VAVRAERKRAGRRADQCAAGATGYDGLLGQESPGPVDLPELRARVAETHRLYQAARYDQVIAMLPAVLLAVEGYPGRHNGQRRESLLAYVSAYVAAAKLVTKLGPATWQSWRRTGPPTQR